MVSKSLATQESPPANAAMIIWNKHQQHDQVLANTVNGGLVGVVYVCRAQPEKLLFLAAMDRLGIHLRSSKMQSS